MDVVQANFDAEMERLLADSAYINGENLTLAEEKELELIGPLSEKQHAENPAIREGLTQPVSPEQIEQLPIRPQTKCFDKAAFVYDESADEYRCPAGKALPHRKTERSKDRHGKSLRREIYTCRDCAGCELSALCRKDPNASGGRSVTVDQYEPARRRHRAKMSQASSQEAYARRTHAGEYPFAVLKQRFDMRRFLLRGIEGVGQEWFWGSTAFNLLKLMSFWRSLRGSSLASPT